MHNLSENKMYVQHKFKKNNSTLYVSKRKKHQVFFSLQVQITLNDQSISTEEQLKPSLKQF